MVVMASSNARAVAPVACLSSRFTKLADGSRLCRVATSRPGNRLTSAGNERVIAAIEDPSLRKEGARRQAKLACDIFSAQASFAPAPFEPSLRLLCSSHLCAASPRASPNNKMTKVKPDWDTLQRKEKLADVKERVARMDEDLDYLQASRAQLAAIGTQQAAQRKKLQEISRGVDAIEKVIYPSLGRNICVTAAELLKRLPMGRRERNFIMGEGDISTASPMKS